MLGWPKYTQDETEALCIKNFEVGLIEVLDRCSVVKIKSDEGCV